MLTKKLQYACVTTSNGKQVLQIAKGILMLQGMYSIQILCFDLATTQDGKINPEV